jgi:putative hydrolase of the HAD superfamily
MDYAIGSLNHQEMQMPIAIFGGCVLKAVTFDLWGTLITERPEGIRSTREKRIGRIEMVLREQGIGRDRDQIDGAYKTVGERLAVLWETHRDISARNQVEILMECLQIAKQDRNYDSLMEHLTDAYTTPILTELPVPLAGVPDILATLALRDLKLAVICNTGRTPGKILRIILDRLGVAKHLSVQTFSDEVGLRKPHREIFELTLKTLNTQPPEALHVGDTLAADIVGARSIGMHAVHLCHPRGADPRPGGGDTIFSLSELPKWIDGLK